MIAWLHSFRKWCWLTFGIGFGAALLGLFAEGGNRLLVGAGLVAMIGVATLIAVRRWNHGRRTMPCRASAQNRNISPLVICETAESHSASAEAAQPGGPQSNDAGDQLPAAAAGSPECRVQEFIDTLMRESRYALLLRPQIAGNLSPPMLAPARQRLEQQMALVPEGDVLVEPHLVTEEPISAAELHAAEGAVVRVGATYVDRFTVTNRQYQIFLNAGGYDQMPLWDPAIWPAVLDFVDATGHPGPRYWRHGRFPAGKADHPVVGVSWYEAAAYARWVGKRLPTDAEWLKAGCWPVQLSPTSRVQRKFPWGNAMDRSRANLWGSASGDTTAVDDFSAGTSVGGLSQLIGNVWEWTAADFELPRPALRRDANGQGGANWPTGAAANASPADRAPSLARPPLKTIRGGAFDTYFDQHAACQFASADSPLARKYNIGFRLALGACDLIATSEWNGDAESEGEPEDSCSTANEDLLQPA